MRNLTGRTVLRRLGWATGPAFAAVPLAALLLLIPHALPVAQVTFTGTVRDAASGSPIPGATVRLATLPAAATTAGDGTYRLTVPRTRLSGSTATLRASKSGYLTATRRVAVSGATVRSEFRLRKRPARLRDARAPVAEQEALKAGGVVRRRPSEPWNTEAYDRIEEQGFVSARAHPLSTFSADVDRASFSNVRRFLSRGRLPPKDAIRIEELVNYFSYDDPAPGGDVPFSVTTEVAPAPWRPAHRLLRIGLKAREVSVDELPPANLTFLVDVSGSMRPADKLPLLTSALRLLVERLRPRDRVSLVAYAGSAGLVLEPTPGDRKGEILEALERLEAGGSTAGGQGLKLAYRVAEEHFLEDGNNRVILATDGDFNVGVSSDAAMQRLVEEKRERGVSLTVLGFGTGNTKFSKMEKMADHGNGNFFYIDGMLEARKALVEEMGGTLLTVAEDVKLQVEFNPERVRAWRLIGYENRRLEAEDFDDDRKDPGEIGAGHSVVAFYEVIPVGVETDAEIREPDTLRYQRRQMRPEGTDAEMAYLKLRYKEPGGQESRLLEIPIRHEEAPPSEDFRFASSVVEFGLVLRASPYRGRASLDRALDRARSHLGEDAMGYRGGFVEMVQTARALEEASAEE